MACSIALASGGLKTKPVPQSGVPAHHDENLSMTPQHTVPE